MTKINIDYQEIKKSYIGGTKTPNSTKILMKIKIFLYKIEL